MTTRISGGRPNPSPPQDFTRAGEAAHDPWHGRLWAYAWHTFIDRRHGAWYRILTRGKRAMSDEKNPAGKTDHHTMGACHDVLAVIRGRHALTITRSA